MEQAIKANHDMIAREREIERMREKAGHDEAQALYNARKKGYAIGYASGFAETKARVEAIKAIATNMLKMNLSMDTIVTATGITNEEWKQLNSNLEMLSPFPRTPEYGDPRITIHIEKNNTQRHN